MTTTVFASFEQLEAIVADRTARQFVWPDEGSFDQAGRFEFNDQLDGFQPLLIDAFSADAMTKIHGALNAKNRATFELSVGRHRGEFAAMFEFAMDQVTVGAAA